MVSMLCRVIKNPHLEVGGGEREEDALSTFGEHAAKIFRDRFHSLPPALISSTEHYLDLSSSLSPVPFRSGALLSSSRPLSPAGPPFPFGPIDPGHCCHQLPAA